VNENGLTVQQVQAIQEFWQFQGSEEIVQDLKPIKNYHQAMRDEKVDTSLASKYGADGQGGNKVVCNVTEDMDRKTRVRMELKTLHFAPPERKKMTQAGKPEAAINQQMIQDALRLATNDAAQEAKEADDKKEEAEEKSEESDEDDSDDDSETDQKTPAFDPTSSQASGVSGNSDKNKSFTSLLAGGVMGTMMESQAINMEIVDIEPPDPKAVKEAVERARETETYRDAMEKLKEHLDNEQDPRHNRRKKHDNEHHHEHHDEQNHLQEREGRAVDMCTLFHTK